MSLLSLPAPPVLFRSACRSSVLPRMRRQAGSRQCCCIQVLHIRSYTQDVQLNHAFCPKLILTDRNFNVIRCHEPLSSLPVVFPPQKDLNYVTLFITLFDIPSPRIPAVLSSYLKVISVPFCIFCQYVNGI